MYAKIGSGGVGIDVGGLGLELMGYIRFVNINIDIDIDIYFSVVDVAAVAVA